VGPELSFEDAVGELPGVRGRVERCRGHGLHGTANEFVGSAFCRAMLAGRGLACLDVHFSLQYARHRRL
jgi:hypothetical protein